MVEMIKMFRMLMVDFGLVEQISFMVLCELNYEDLKRYVINLKDVKS